ncbi:interferon-induced protein 44-like [Acipenser oxyrinchus oxyrinchus]|uniref:Interferon-induced protein 44-like n=1 Tax=Acipenser oxyrinchus oxyrinchus TaxID=40147 RepID=A0AAD8D5X9_ACIOX|nr:interferon-induced protein 44-like [Acipenser oxyrinchus oxyrinchus]
MAEVKSNLSKQAESQLLSLFEPVKLSLLYKASVHGYNSAAFHNKCDRQGPTLTVGYNNSGFIFGGYTSKSFAQTGQYLADEKAFLFSWKSNDPEKQPLRIPVANAQYAIHDNNLGPNFGTALVFLNGNVAAVITNPGQYYTFNAAELHGGDLNLTECEVYRVESLGYALEKPWRTVQWKAEKRKELIDTIRSYKPPVLSVPQFRVLLVGPVGAGKSSFFNSVNSVFRGHVTNQAPAGSSATSLTTKFRSYFTKAGRDGKPLPVVLCDSMGLEEVTGAGLDVDDVVSIIKGHVPDRYQFNPSMAIQENTPGFIKSAEMKDRIHCVAFVMDACKVKIMSAKLEEKLSAIRKKVNFIGVPQLVLLTKVDEACELVASDVSSVYKSKFIEGKMQEVGARLGIPVSCIVPVKNYSTELELDCNTDILLLSAVVQMLRFADNYFDDISFDEKCD